MNRILLTICVTAVAALGIGAAYSSPSPSKNEMIAAADALDKAFIAAFNKGDATALSNLYWNSPDVVFFPPDTMVVHGIAAIKEGMQVMTGNQGGIKLEMTESHNRAEGTVVLGWGLWKLTLTGPDGQPMEMTGRYSDVKAVRDGKWVYLMDHASVPMPMESAP